MLEEIKDNYIPILIIIETLNQLNISLKEHLQNESIVLPTHFEQVGGFKNVLQIKGFQLRKQYLHLLKTNHPQNTPLNEKQIKRLFQSFILIDDKHNIVLSSSIDHLSKETIELVINKNNKFYKSFS
jgi:hypothetical protein